MDRKQGRERGITCSKGPQVESNPGPLREDIASVYGAPALPTEPPGTPNCLFFFNDETDGGALSDYY